MTLGEFRSHPWMANSNDEAIQHMLETIGAERIDELFEQIPSEHRTEHTFDLPRALTSETELRRHLDDTLGRNADCAGNLSFLGGGCWQHYVPAVVDEVVTRAEFLTPVWGSPSSDLGRNQAWFEFCSQLGELLEMEFVGLPVYSYGCAAGHAIRMAARITGRDQVLVPESLDPERLAVIRSYAARPGMRGHIDVEAFACDWETGSSDLADVARRLSDRTAAIYLENPCFLGALDRSGPEVAALAAERGAQTIVGVDPISLGVLAPPATWGADIVVGTMQSLGVHMNCGGGVGGFIATRDEERYAREYPTLCLSVAETSRPGEHGFGVTLFEQTSYGSRDKAKDWTGNSTYLWAVAGAVYMALLGPQGFREIGETILERSHYASRRIGQLPGLRVPLGESFFKEFVVDFEGTGKTVDEVNAALRERGIFGGQDLSKAFPQLGNAALYCVTEIHTKEDIDRLVDALAEVTHHG